MELVKDTPARQPHEHVDGRCRDCYADGERVGYGEGSASGWEAAIEETPSPDYVREREAEALAEAVRGAHRAARHSGRWEDCGDIVCSALERYVYERTRPEVCGTERGQTKKMARMVAG